MKKKYLALTILLIISIGLTIFTYFNDFLYHKTIMKITDIKTISTETLTNSLNFEEKHYYQEITGKITNGKNKGKTLTIEYEKTYSSIVTEKYQKGDKVFIKDNSIDNLKRDFYLVILIDIFILSLFLVAGHKSLLIITSLIFNIFVFLLGLKLYDKNISLFLICFICSIIFIISSLLLSSGKNKKTLSAIISTIVSIIILILITSIITKITNYDGINLNNFEFLTVPINDIFLTELLISGLGAIMDVAITITSPLKEIIDKNPKIKKKDLKKSGLNIGKDIMGTMVNVLFFTYLCSGLPLFVLALRNGFTLSNYINTYFSLEITRFLVGSIGLILTIPITIYITTKIFKRGDINE